MARASHKGPMTPQELMDLPYAGMAEKKLRELGVWKPDALEVLYSIEPSHEIPDSVDAAIELAIQALEEQQ